MKILLLEDDLATSQFLVHTLATHRYAVDAIADGAIGLELASCWPYDLLIVDWELPSLSGLEVCRRLRAEGSSMPILMLTVKGNTDDIVAGLDAGADDYLTKSSDALQLLARVRALLRRGDRTASPVLCWGDLCLDPALTQVTYQQQPIPCRPKEYELLELFLRSPRRLLTRSAIIDHLWPMADTPVEGSITNLIKDLRQRLKAAGAPSPIETVYGLGYRLKPDPKPDPQPDPPAPNPSPPRLDQVVQQATQRFRTSLGQRLTVLDAAIDALKADAFSPHQQRLAYSEAHKLAGGLEVFGYPQAAAAAAAIEHLLSLPESDAAAESAILPQLSLQLAKLKQSLTLPLGDESLTKSGNITA